MGGGEEHVHPYKHRWPQNGVINGYDWRAIRRGRQVYSEVFAPCHSLKFAWYRMFSYFMTDAEIKALAAQKITPSEEPEEDGTYSWRPQKPADRLPSPYRNDREARYANGGALPPDLSNITRARHDGMNYVYALMTGYKEDLPAGFPELRPGQFFNPYFPGGVIGMPPPLSDEMLEYEDGTPATKYQMAKDVTQFLEFVFDPKHDEGKKYLIKFALNLGAGALLFGWMSRRMGRAWYAGTLTWFKKYKH